MLHKVDSSFDKIGLHLKPSECRSLSIVGGTCKDVFFKLKGEQIPNIVNDKFKFLGSTIYHTLQTKNITEAIIQDMSSTLSKIDNLPIRGSYKLKLYEIYATPRLRFPLTVHDLTTRGLEKMDVLVKHFVKKWLKIPRTANIDMLQHSKGRSLEITIVFV